MHRFTTHRIFFGHKSEISNYQVRVYGSPRIRAISTREPDQEKVQTALVLALHQGFNIVSRDFNRVNFFVPPHLHDWTIAQVGLMAGSLTKRIRAEQMGSSEAKEQGTKILRILKEWIEHLHFPKEGKSWPAMPPDHWVAFGYTATDAGLPSWVKIALG